MGGGRDSPELSLIHISTPWLALNATYSALWPNIAHRKDAPVDADVYRDEAGKFDKYFSAKPGATV